MSKDICEIVQSDDTVTIYTSWLHWEKYHLLMTKHAEEDSMKRWQKTSLATPLLIRSRKISKLDDKMILEAK